MEGPAGQKRVNIFTIPAAGGPDTRLTDLPAPHDGPEYSPDGKWIYFNSERASPGHAQCFRMRADGTGIEQLTFDERVNWFPHPPRREMGGLSELSARHPGHPADKQVILRLMRPDSGGRRDVIAFWGGQGTINVNSWAPDSQRFAYGGLPTSDIR